VIKAITGGDPIQAEAKYRTSFTFHPYARLLFSANNPPRSPDSSQGFYDRWLVIPFESRFRGEENEIRAAQLDAKLAAPTELSGLLNKALAMLSAVRAKGYTPSASTDAALAEFRSVTDPFSLWLMTRTERDPDAVTACAALQKSYTDYSVASMHAPPSPNAFTRMLRTHAPYVEKKQRTIDRAKGDEWCYLGIRLLPQPTTGGRRPSTASTASTTFSLPLPIAREEDNSSMWWIEKDKEESSKGKEKHVEVVEVVERETASAYPSYFAAGGPCRHDPCRHCGAHMWGLVEGVDTCMKCLRAWPPRGA
jgi:phage/plasmid-associated DNA primase